MPPTLPRPRPWFLPSFHGDIRLEAAGDEATVIIAARLSNAERAALASLRTWAVAQDLHRARGGAEASRLLFPPVTEETGRGETEARIVIATPLARVQAVLARTLKPTRVLVGVVHFADGTLEETFRSEPAPAGPASEAYREAPPLPAAPTPKTKPKGKKKEPDAGATVAAPVIGCPPPNFSPADERANRVLEHFLTPDQYADWRRDQRFVQIGHDTGHRFLLTSRLNRDALRRAGGRSLFDLDTNVPYCTHDWDVPAAEELLSLRIFLALPGGEAYLRTIPADPYLGH